MITKSLATYTSFETDLMRLGWIRKETRTIFEQYPIPNPPTNGFHIRTIVRSYLVIKLHDFIETRRKLCKDLNDMNKLGIDKCLKPFWEPIVRHRETIRQLRNAYLAHIQKKGNFKEHINTIIFENKYPSSHGDARFFAGCVWKYCDAIIFNFPESWKSAGKKYSASTPLPIFVHNVATTANAEAALREAINEAIGNLKANGFRISP